MEYPREFAEKVREVLTDACLPGAAEAIRALESGQGAPLGMALEYFSQFHYSSSRIMEFFACGEERKIWEAAQLAVSCQALWVEWDKLYRAQRPRL